MATERQQLIEEIIREKRESIDLLETSNQQYQDIIDFIKAPVLRHFFNGIGSWLIRIAAFLVGLAMVATAFFFMFSLYWPDELWDDLIKEISKVEYHSIEDVKKDIADSLMFTGILILIAAVFLLILTYLIGRVRKRSKTIYQLTAIMKDMLDHQRKYLRHEQNAYINLTQELKAPDQ